MATILIVNGIDNTIVNILYRTLTSHGGQRILGVVKVGMGTARLLTELPFYLA